MLVVSAARYGLAILASLVAWGLSRHVPDQPGTAFLFGIAGVIVSSVMPGPGPGVVATVLTTAWSAWIPGSGVVWCGLFFAEGLFLCICSDRFRKAAKRAGKSEEWPRSLVETASEGSWVTDGRGVIGFANPRIADLLGVGPEELVGRNMEDFLFPGDMIAERIRLRNLRKGLREQFDRRLRHRDGREVWVLTCASQLPDSGVLAMMTEITERKQAEQTLRRSESRFRSMFENSMEGAYQTSPEGRILTANPALLHMPGLRSHEQLDAVVSTELYVDPTLRVRLADRMQREGSIRNAPYQLRRPDGNLIMVQENARVVRNEEGEVLCYEGTLREMRENVPVDKTSALH